MCENSSNNFFLYTRSLFTFQTTAASARPSRLDLLFRLCFVAGTRASCLASSAPNTTPPSVHYTATSPVPGPRHCTHSMWAPRARVKDRDGWAAETASRSLQPIGGPVALHDPVEPAAAGALQSALMARTLSIMMIRTVHPDANLPPGPAARGRGKAAPC